MEKKIFKNMSIIILLTALLFTTLTGILFQNSFGEQIKDALKTRRVTIIDQSGDVLFDNQHSNLKNHGNRPEVIAARENGFGESERHSDTTGKTTYYYAIKMTDNNILRLSFTMESVYSWLYGFIPIILLSLLIVLIFSHLLAKRLTNHFIDPINTIDLDRMENLPYDELAPFARKIKSQKIRIEDQFLALEKRADTIKTITENMKEGLIFIDQNGVILSFNKSIVAIFSDIDVAKNILEINRSIPFLDNVKKALAGEHTEMIFKHRQKTYSVFFSPAKTEKELLAEEIDGAILLFLDVTDKKLAEKQRREFSANVSHELKTPLTTISALSEMIGNNLVKPEDVLGFAQKINDQSLRLLAIIDDIIKLSELDESGMKVTTEEFDLCALAREICDHLLALANQKQLKMTPPSNSFMVKANKRMIRELIFNLVDNAIKYNKAGGLIKVVIEGEDDRVKMTVSDTGIGIRKKDQKRIFERFYRVDKSRSKRTGGTGLGLSIVKHIAIAHGGFVTIDSEIDQGTCIIVYLSSTPV